MQGQDDKEDQNKEHQLSAAGVIMLPRVTFLYFWTKNERQRLVKTSNLLQLFHYNELISQMSLSMITGALGVQE